MGISCAAMWSSCSTIVCIILQAPHNVVNYALESATYTNINTQVDALAYFQVDPSTGWISLRQSLLLDSNNPSTYTVIVYFFYIMHIYRVVYINFATHLFFIFCKCSQGRVRCHLVFSVIFPTSVFFSSSFSKKKSSYCIR